ncbi:MAG: ATP-binding cassette domain-containing protein [Proteobacteria bacterium]|nr:ATP-binding cassette domain-containing protein [Pseudomonadota bacterium]
MIEASKLCKRYGDFVAVSDVTFTAAVGDIVGFLGPNGAGKTSTIRILSTYLPPTSGTAKVAGFDVMTQADQVRKHIGYLPETPPLYPEMSVEEYLTFVARIKGVPSAQVRERVAESIDRCFLGDVRKKLCQHLSRGYRQRAGLAQAIIHNPKVVILDEPTSGLDPRQIVEIRELISSLAKEHTVILSTHILPEVSMVCNKVVIINRGRVVLEQGLTALTAGNSLEKVFMECISQETPEPLSAVVGG